ncbi:pyridoxamine 5'-phosphate oxidase family protein [Aureimonas fodinaquatilis]|uniref:Pyridoxamine 5'-phosphate oxidase family protein n=2 Tax=Aureimonas fodinaquatilis TaxID=2565783 RepID=A0A5B0DXZ9_9HYPH|nr:pyridoxamine 5'-phosphate oxidase family protein [Aureimonas fodinaquatilis]
MRTDIQNSVLCWLATVDSSGTPNVTPKEIFSSYGDDRIVVADIASTNTVRNIRSHPTVCVSFIDIFRQRGFKVVGSATIIGPEEPDFAIVGADLLRLAGVDFPIRHVISIHMERVSRIWAPSYALFPDRTEEERIQVAYDTYGVVAAG